MTTDRTSNAKISEALELLNEAAKEKTNELKGLMENRYSHIKEAMSSGLDHGKEVLKHTQEFAQDAIQEGSKKAKEIASNVDKNVHENPWAYIAGAAGISLVVGYLMGSKRK